MYVQFRLIETEKYFLFQCAITAKTYVQDKRKY